MSSTQAELHLGPADIRWPSGLVTCVSEVVSLNPSDYQNNNQPALGILGDGRQACLTGTLSAKYVNVVIHALGGKTQALKKIRLYRHRIQILNFCCHTSFGAENASF